MSPKKETYQPDQVLDHDYDGIQEYDNRLPNWWLWILWGSIVFAIGYWLVFHTYGIAKGPVAQYEAEMEAGGGSLAALSTRGLTEDDLIAMSREPARLAQGREVWTQYCVVCHKPGGEGLVGPNLTDDYWINGGGALDIHNTVVAGVPDKGMAAWGNQLGPDRVDAVVAHLLTLRGTNIEGKAPEGDLYQPEESNSAPIDPQAESATEALAEETVETEVG
jgi:cytochrome c oxidase cbb3-type subunit 3